MATNVLRWAVFAALAAMLGLGVGCEQRLRMGKYDLSVAPDASLRDSVTGRMPQVEVDLIGIKDDETGAWNGYSVDKYFSGDDEQRRNASGYTRSLVFGNGNEAIMTVPASDPIWATWEKRGVTRLLIMANSRTMRSGGGVEVRRRDIPLTTDKWDVKQIDIVVKSTGVEVPTPMKVVK